MDLDIIEHRYVKLLKGPEAFVSFLHALGVSAPHLTAWLTIQTELSRCFAVPRVCSFRDRRIDASRSLLAFLLLPNYLGRNLSVMNILIVGAGGVGGYFGAKLAVSGNDVTFVARGAHLEAIRNTGLRIQSPLGNLSIVDAKTAQHLSEVPFADFVLVAVKLWELDGVAKSLTALVQNGATVISLQNGVQKDDILRRYLPADSIVGGICYISASIAEPGVIRHTGNLQRIVVGEYNGQLTDRVRSFENVVGNSGIDIEVVSEIERLIWEKFIFLVGLSGSTATIRQPIGVIRNNPRARKFLLDIVSEVIEVARAKGISIPEDFANQQMTMFDRLPEGMIASMFHDLRQKNRLELPWLSGVVAQIGEEYNIPTPRNRAISDILAIYSDGGVQS